MISTRVNPRCPTIFFFIFVRIFCDYSVRVFTGTN
jgi:hypothetical protein